MGMLLLSALYGFNPRTYIRYDLLLQQQVLFANCFNPRTYIRYDAPKEIAFCIISCFNPRTYIRYDKHSRYTITPNEVSIHVPI